MDREFLIGVEVNSKHITTGLVDLSGKIVKRMTIPSDVEKGRKQVIDNISSSVKKIQKNKIIGVGVSIPGIVNREKGVVVESPFPGWTGIMLKKLLEDQLRLPVYIENEGKCFALAEYKCGTYRKTENTIGVLFNDAISSGLIVDGRLAKGCASASGLVSESIIDNKKAKLGDVASSASIERIFKTKTKKAKPIQDIIALSRDKNAKDILTNAGNSVGATMSHLVNALNPELIIIGGPLSRSETFLDAVEETIQSKSGEYCGKKVRIVGSKMNDSGVLGASSIVM